MGRTVTPFSYVLGQEREKWKGFRQGLDDSHLRGSRRRSPFIENREMNSRGWSRARKLLEAECLKEPLH